MCSSGRHRHDDSRGGCDQAKEEAKVSHYKYRGQKPDRKDTVTCLQAVVVVLTIKFVFLCVLISS